MVALLAGNVVEMLSTFQPLTSRTGDDCSAAIYGEWRTRQGARALATVAWPLYERRRGQILDQARVEDGQLERRQLNPAK